MVAVASYCELFGLSPRRLAFNEIHILEVELFMRVCDVLKQLCIENNKTYCSSPHLGEERGGVMLETKFLCFVINDILHSEEYSLTGIACYTQIPEDVLSDIATGHNQFPSLQVSQKLIDLHRQVRPDLYHAAVKKILNAYQHLYFKTQIPLTFQ